MHQHIGHHLTYRTYRAHITTQHYTQHGTDKGGPGSDLLVHPFRARRRSFTYSSPPAFNWPLLPMASKMVLKRPAAGVKDGASVKQVITTPRTPTEYVCVVVSLGI